ncbi:MAG: hypothetical protein IT388_07655 [Nitrospirales bacterium]|nr:hypothetical protein [Nitrospirales bacterium]
MKGKAFAAAAVMVVASLVGLYYHVTETGTTKVVMKQEKQISPATSAPPAEKEVSPAQPVYQFSTAAPSSAGMGDVSALISRYLPGKQDGFETRLKLSEALYENNYAPDARGIFNSLNDADICGFITSKTPGARCEGDMRAKLGELLYADGYLKLAKDLLTALVSESTARMTNVGIDAFKTLRSAYRSSGEMAKYESLIESIPESYPLKPEILMDAANFYAEEGNKEKAKSILTAALDKFPQNTALHAFMESRFGVESVQ